VLHDASIQSAPSIAAAAISMSSRYEGESDHDWSDEEEIPSISSAKVKWASLGMDEPVIRDMVQCYIKLLTDGNYRAENEFCFKGNRACLNVRGFARHLLRCRVSVPELPTAVLLEIWRYAFGRALHKMPNDAAEARNDVDSKYEEALSNFFAKSNHDTTAAALDREVHAIISEQHNFGRKISDSTHTRKARLAREQVRHMPCDRDD
jgi:hypothetical protein